MESYNIDFIYHVILSVKETMFLFAHELIIHLTFNIFRSACDQASHYMILFNEVTTKSKISMILHFTLLIQLYGVRVGIFHASKQVDTIYALF